MESVVPTIAGLIAVVISCGGLIYNIGWQNRRIEDQEKQLINLKTDHDRRLVALETRQAADHDLLTTIREQIKFLYDKAQPRRRGGQDA